MIRFRMTRLYMGLGRLTVSAACTTLVILFPRAVRPRTDSSSADNARMLLMAASRAGHPDRNAHPGDSR